MLAEIGLVGKGPNKYNLHLGGNREGTRIPKMYKENITDTEIMTILDELIGQWASEREANEAFGDFVVRAGIVAPVINSASDFYA
jgi:sulfite reductase (NADPH) hemoprotein beta-component